MAFRGLSFVLTLALAALWLFTLRPVSLGGPAGYIMVSGRSMEPTFYTGDLVLTRQQDDYEAGDVVAFRVPDHGQVIHRIIGGNGEDGYELQGDNNSWVDSWHPTNSEVVGKQWVHLPGMADRLKFLREPARIAALFAGVGALGFVKLGDTQKKRRRKDGGHVRESDKQTGKGMQLPGFTGVTVAMGAAALLTLVFGIAAFTAFRTPETKTLTLTRASYEHSGAFDYLVQTEPSTLYPTGIIGPVSAPAGGPGGAVQVPPVYTRLTRSLDVGFAYSLNTAAVSDLRGEIGAELQIRALGDNGWTRIEQLLTRRLSKAARPASASRSRSRPTRS